MSGHGGNSRDLILPGRDLMMLEKLFKHINVETGDGCNVSQFCSLENVVLGNNVSISDSVQLKNVVVGDHTKIGRNATLYSSDPDRPVRIGNHCWFSYGVFGEATGGEIQIADYVVIAHNTTMLTSSGPGKGSPVMNVIYPVESGPVLIGAHSWIGAHCVLLCGSVIEEGTVIGANSMVSRKSTKSGWAVYGGTPARLIKKIDQQIVAAAKASVMEQREPG